MCAFNKRFYQGATKTHIQDAMNPYAYLVPALKISDDSKDEQHCQISISHPVEQEVVRHEYRLEHKVIPAHHTQGNEWSFPRENRGCDDSV
jgi:hypothetical protein